MKKYIILCCVFVHFVSQAQIAPINSSYWLLEELVTPTTSLTLDVEENLESGNIIIGTAFTENTFTLFFDSCNGLIAEPIYDNQNSSFTLSNLEVTLHHSTDNCNEFAHGVGVVFLGEFFFDNNSDRWNEPFRYSFEFTPCLAKLIITNNKGSEAIFSQTTLSGQDFNKPSLSVYPNPATNEIFIDHGFDDIHTIQIFNLQGKLMINKKPSSENSLQIESLSKGVYILKATTNKGNITQKLIKK